MSLKIHDRKQFQNFLRTITGQLSKFILSAEKGRPKLLAKNAMPRSQASTPTATTTATTTTTTTTATATATTTAKGQKDRFWDTLAFTRVADWGRQFTNLRKYIFRNVLEASGAITYDRKNLKWIEVDSA